MIKVCDAIMGSGKTCGVINYINEHPEKHYLYITPFLSEAERIRDACPELHFVQPQENVFGTKGTKTSHTAMLLEEGRNITSTHQASYQYYDEIYELIRNQHYTVIIDEQIDVLNKEVGIFEKDLQLLQMAGVIAKGSGDSYVATDRTEWYDRGALLSVVKKITTKKLLRLDNGTLLYWVYSPKLLEAAEDVIVLTYMMKGSQFEAFLKLNGFDYVNIGVEKYSDGTYHFIDHIGKMPSYVKNLKDLIIFEDSDRMNFVGKNKAALSENWYDQSKNKQGVVQLQKNLFNYFNMHNRGVDTENRLCATFNKHWGKIRGKGYWNRDLAFSARSQNGYRNCTVLAYPVNVFLNPYVQKFFASNNCPVDNDVFALSTMVQWIWRSAIRDGKQVHLYVPSKRMRDLLINWIDEVSK